MGMEKYSHPEWKGFTDFFNRLLLKATNSCWERDILRDNKDTLWEWWKDYAERCDNGPKERK
jgi:hypothetical protein